MAEIIRLRTTPHDEAEALLPWFVNGTLHSAEIERVEAHLIDCADCRAALAAERQLAAGVATIQLDTSSSWERMKQRLDLGAPAQFRPVEPLWRRRVPAGWAIASPFAAAAAVALLFVNVAPERPAEPQYHALSAPANIQPANLVVQFEPSTRVSDMQRALGSVDARLVDGPTETGAYLLRVDQGRRELALKRLRDSDAIALAEPIDAPARQ
jgi:hypothetical protein